MMEGELAPLPSSRLEIGSSAPYLFAGLKKKKRLPTFLCSLLKVMAKLNKVPN